MIVAIDCETRGLEATREAFLMGCLIDENNSENIFFNAKEMWDSIVERGIHESKRGSVMHVYAHNMGNYDFWCIADRTDKNLRFLSLHPFICNYEHQGKDIIKFLDTYSLFKMPLEELGRMIGMEKGITPEAFKEGRDISMDELKEHIPYMVQDTKICMEALRMLKSHLAQDGIHIKRLITIHQIAIQYMLNELKKHKPEMFYDERFNSIKFTKWTSHIHEAYRGGRVECFKTGVFENTHYIDVNSLYPKALMEMRFPDLDSQEKILFPLNRFSTTELLGKIGVARALLYNEKNEIGILPIRLQDFSYYPKKGKYLIGTWTLQEISKAVKNGYILMDMEWAIFYGETENPYSKIIPETYKKRKESGTTFDDYLYKNFMNNHLGKFAQIHSGQELRIIDVEDFKDYSKKGYEMLMGIEKSTDVIVKRNPPDSKLKSYYCPILPTLANADARLYMYDNYAKIPLHELIYTDTDSILFQGDHIKRFKISNEIGDMKVVHENKRCIMWGRKTYSIGSDIKASGIHRSDLSSENFEKGYLEIRQMNSLGNNADINSIGKFTVQKRDLRLQNDEYQKLISEIENRESYADFTLKDYTYFNDALSKTPYEN